MSRTGKVRVVSLGLLPGKVVMEGDSSQLTNSNWS